MDLATLIGLVSVIGVVVGAILIGGDIGIFINVPSLIIVIGGTLAATIIRVSLGQFLGSFKVGLKAVFNKQTPPEKLIEEAVELANVARKEGILALENAEISDPFLKRSRRQHVQGHR